MGLSGVGGGGGFGGGFRLGMMAGVRTFRSGLGLGLFTGGIEEVMILCRLTW